MQSDDELAVGRQGLELDLENFAVRVREGDTDANPMTPRARSGVVYAGSRGGNGERVEDFPKGADAVAFRQGLCATVARSVATQMPG